MDLTALRMTLGSRSMEIPLRNIETAECEAEWRWGGIWIRDAGRGAALYRGMSRADPRDLADVLEAARVFGGVRRRRHRPPG